jgi:hypothetical protein
MRLPGFGAESALYKTTGHYQMSQGLNRSGEILPQRLKQKFHSCTKCYWRNEECVAWCTDCEWNPTANGGWVYDCTSGAESCAGADCEPCPQAETPCQAGPFTPRACCAAGQRCCDGVCCPPGQQCCDGVCCPPDQQCCDGNQCNICCYGSITCYQDCYALCLQANQSLAQFCDVPNFCKQNCECCCTGNVCGTKNQKAGCCLLVTC